MTCETNCCVLSRGELFIADSDDSCEMSELFCCEFSGNPFRKLGNVLSCDVTISSEINGKPNKYLNKNTLCPRKTILGVSLTLTLGCASYKNLLLALSPEEVEKSAGEMQDTFILKDASVDPCQFFPFSKKGVDLDSIVVDFLDVNEEYLVSYAEEKIIKSRSGISLDEGDTIVGAIYLRISYDYNDEDFNVASLSDKLSGPKSLYFKGVNYSDSEDSEALFDASFEKVLFNPINNFDLINQSDFFTITLSGVVEKKGKDYFTITKQEN